MTLHVYQTPQAIYLNKGVGSPNQNYPVNRTDFKIFDGVKNEVEVFVKDLDRKPVDMTGLRIVMNILDRNKNRMLLEKELEIIDAVRGRYRLTIDTGDNLPIGIHIYSVITVDDFSTEILYTDRNRGSSSYLEVVEGPFANPTPSVVVSQDDMLFRNNRYYTGAIAGAASVDRRDGLHALLWHPEGFSGRFTIEATLEAQPDASDSMWFVVASDLYVEQSQPVHHEFEGMYTFVRANYEIMGNGVVNQITFRN